jgi:hypothetical protein
MIQSLASKTNQMLILSFKAQSYLNDECKNKIQEMFKNYPDFNVDENDFENTYK